MREGPGLQRVEQGGAGSHPIYRSDPLIRHALKTCTTPFSRLQRPGHLHRG